MSFRTLLPVLGLLMAAQQVLAWSTVRIRVVDIGLKPVANANVRYQYHSGDGGPFSMTQTTDDSGYTPVFDAGGAEFDSIWNLTATDGVDTAYGTAAVTKAQMDAGTAGNELKDSYNYRKTYRLDYRWTKSPLASDSGFVVVPGVPYQVVYDPPGDASMASQKNSTTFQTSVKTSFGSNLGATLSFGYSIDALVVSAETEVAASVNYKQAKENEFTVTVARSQTLATSAGADPLVVGPGRGDLFLMPSLKMKWQLWRSWQPKDPKRYKGQGADTGYVYKLVYSPVADPSNTQLVVTANYLRETYASQPALLARLLGASAIDPATGRVRDALRHPVTGIPTGSRLALLNGGSLTAVSGGGGGISEDYDSSVTQSETVTWELDIGLEAMAKVTAGGASVGTKLTAGISVGGAKADARTFARSIHYEVADAQPWDIVSYRLYLDRVYGTYVFDVDTTTSWTSIPFEAGYSRPSIDWRVRADRDTIQVAKGQTARFALEVLNRNRTGASSLDTIRAISVGAIRLSGTDVVVDPVELNSPRGVARTVNVAVAAPDTGTYRVEIKLVGSVGQLNAQTTSLEQVVPLVVKVVPTTAVKPAHRKGDLRIKGALLAVTAEPGEEWSLEFRDLGGRKLGATRGVGAVDLPLPEGSGLVVARWSSASGGSSQVLIAR